MNARLTSLRRFALKAGGSLAVLLVLAWWSPDTLRAQPEEGSDPPPSSEATTGKEVRPDGQGAKREEGPKGPRFGGGDRRDGRPDGGLKSEERERIRETLQAVWDDPAVIQARAEVKQASEAYRRALRQAVQAKDPEVASLMERMFEDSRSKALEVPAGGEGRAGGPSGHGMPLKGGPRGEANGRPAGRLPSGLDFVMRPPFYQALSEKERQIYDQALRQVMASGALKGIQDAFKGVQKEDEALRRKRIGMFRQARETMFTAMKEVDPRVKDLIEAHAGEAGEGREARDEARPGPGQGGGSGRPGARGPGGSGPSRGGDGGAGGDGSSRPPLER